MEEWDKKDARMENILKIAEQWMAREQNKPQLHRLILNVTTEELQKVAEALKQGK